MVGALVALKIGNIINSKAEKSKSDIDSLNVGLSFKTKLDNFDPHSIQVDSEAEVAFNLYSRLFEYNREGEIEGDLVQEASWEGLELKITLKKGVKTISGHELGVEDVLSSLRRITNKSNMTHGDLKSIICPNTQSNTQCPGISTRDGYIFIKVQSELKKEFLIPLLASIDHSIVPLTAIQEEKDILSIRNFTETSGPYYVADHDEFIVKLKANPLNHKFNEKMPQNVQLYLGNYGDLHNYFYNGKVDYVCFTAGVTKKDLLQLDPKDKALYSDEIKLKFLAFTRKGLERFSATQRIGIGKSIKSRFFNSSEKINWTPSYIAFPESSFGGINPQEIVKLSENVKDYDLHGVPHPIAIVTSKLAVEEYQGWFDEKENIKFIAFSDTPPWTMNIKDQPDAYLLNIDSLFHEDVSLLYYGFSIDLFGDKEDAEIWFENYMKLNTEDRKMKLSLLHKNMIESGRIIPFGFSPYIALIRNGLNYQNNEEFPGSEIWKIRSQ